MNSLLRLLPYLKRHKWPLAFGFACVVVSNVLAVEGWVWAMEAIDAFKIPNIGRETVFLYALTCLAIFALGACFRFLMRRLIIDTSRIVEYEFRNDLFEHMQRLSPSYYDQHMTGDLMSHATNDMDMMRMVLGPGMMYPINAVVIVPLVAARMLSLNPLLTAVAWTPMLITPLFVRHFARSVHRRARKVQDQFSIMSARVQENLAGIRVVKSLAREAEEISLFQRMNEDYRRLSMKLMSVQAFFFPLMKTIVGLGIAAVIAVGAWMVARNGRTGHGGLTFGGFFAFIGLYNELVWPMIALGWIVTIVERSAASMKRISRILDAKPAIPPAVDEPVPPDAPPIEGRIEFRHLSFSYDGQPVLRDIDISLEKGKTLGVVGSVGSGKSSLLNLIPRLYPSPGGQLFIDGRDINDIPVSQLRSAVAVVPQETFLFSETIRENIAFGTKEPDVETVRGAAQTAQLAQAIEEFPDQYDTMLGERGVNLSGGQKQRAAIARALIRDPKILLLDDCLSSVDTETEAQILQGLRGELARRTSIIVSHRISTVAMADEIVVLEQGRIAERGTHDELIASGGLYAELARLQRLEEEIERAGENNGAGTGAAQGGR